MAARTLFRNLCGGGLPVIDPASLPGLELYLRSDQVPGSHGAAINQWNDISGNARHATQAVGSMQPTLNVTANTSPNGTRLVAFNGLDFPNGSIMSRAWPNSPATTLGTTIYIVGRIYDPVCASLGSVIFSDDTSMRPQLIVNQAGAGVQMGWRDAVSTKLGGAFVSGWQQLTWSFETPVGTGTGRLERADNTIMSNAGWNWNSVLTGYWVGAGPDTVPTKVDLGAVIYFSRFHDTATRQAVRRFLKGFFGV